MKKSIKYIILAIGSVGVFLFSLVFFSILSDYFTTNYDVTLILPMLCLVLLVAAIICTIVSAFKFSNEKRLKTILVITIVLYLLSATFHILGRVINPYVNRESNTSATITKKQTKIDKDVFLDRFFDSAKSLEAEMRLDSNGSEEDSYRTCVYAISDKGTSAQADLFVMYDTNTNNLISVAFSSTPKDASLVSTLLELTAKILKDRTPNLTEKCGIAPYVHTNSHIETEYMTIMKTTEGDTFFIHAMLH